MIDDNVETDRANRYFEAGPLLASDVCSVGHKKIKKIISQTRCD